jgi:glycosyltransferase involved in cell wall biosynthesis
MKSQDQKSAPLEALYLYAGSRKGFYDAYLRGEVPDTRLLGLNHLHRFGVHAELMETPLAQTLRKINFNLVHLAYLPYVRRYDVIFLGAGLPLVFIARLLLRWNRPKFVLFNTYYANLLKRHPAGVLHQLLFRALRAADAIVCITHTQRDALIESGLDATRVHYLPLGVDSEKRPADTSDGGYILSVGRDMARDYRTLFAAAEGLDMPIHVVALQENIAGLHPPANVHLHINILYEQVMDLYRNASMVVVPVRAKEFISGSDASGQYGYLEPMAYAKAVIVSDRPGVEDYITSDQDGVLVPAEDPTALRSAIQALWSSPEKRKRLGDAARRKVEAEFSTVRFAERLADLFQELARTDKSPHS